MTIYPANLRFPLYPQIRVLYTHLYNSHCIKRNRSPCQERMNMEKFDRLVTKIFWVKWRTLEVSEDMAGRSISLEDFQLRGRDDVRTIGRYLRMQQQIGNRLHSLELVHRNVKLLSLRW